MNKLSRYPNGFPNGVSIKNLPIINTYGGNVFWVDSGTGTDSGKGTETRPFATIDYAVGRCTASNGDIIMVKAGHTESVIAAGGLDLDVAGITIVFLGDGTNRATIDFGTAVTADMDVDAANITLVNPRFTASIDALTGPIDVNSTDFTILNGEYYDGTAIDTTDCIVATSGAARLKIDGWKYIKGTEAGTQKQSNIQLNGVDDAELSNIDIWGDFATGNIENVTDEVLNIRLENIKLNNTNATPKPGMVIDANATGFAKNIDIRIASGTTYVSNVGKLNWDSTSVGYNADGEGGDFIGTADSLSIEGKIDTLQAEFSGTAGIASFPTGAQAANAVSMAEVMRYTQEAVRNGTGTALATNKSLVDALGTNGTAVTDSAVSVLGAVGANNANNAFSSATVAANEDGSVLERLEQIQEAVNIGTGTNLSANKSLIDVLGSDGTTVTDSAVSVLGAIGANNNNNAFDSSTVVANEDGSVLERLEQIQEATNVGTGTSLAANKSLVDALGTNGTTVTDSAVSVLGAIGANNANNAFDSSTVAGNADGSVLKRLENLLTKAGETFTITKTITSSDLPNNTQTLALTGASTGALLVEEITINTDGTGFANPTNVEISSNNAKGVTGADGPIYVEAVASMGANTTNSTKDAVSHTLPYVLESGKILYIHGSDNTGTGAGTGDVTIVFRRMADGASIAAA